MNKISFIIFFIIILVSCKKDDVVNETGTPHPPDPLCRVIRAEITGNSYYTEYQYDSLKRISAFIEHDTSIGQVISTTFFTYSPEKISISYSYGGWLFSIGRYFLSANGKIDSSIYSLFDYQTLYSMNSTYEYDLNGYLISKTINETYPDTFSYTIEYIISGGNVMTENIISGGTVYYNTRTYSYYYDKPLKYDFITNGISAFGKSNRNPVRSITENDKSTFKDAFFPDMFFYNGVAGIGKTLRTHNAYNYTYEYDSLNYITREIKVTIDSTGTDTIVTLYNYICD